MGIKLSTIFELLKNYDMYGFQLLYENYFRLMYGVAFSICRNDEISKDAIQNTMMNLYKLDANKFPTHNELGWLYKVVKNETLQLLRKEKTKISIDDIEDIPVLDKSIETLVDMDSCNYLINSLNEEQKKIVTLKIICGLTHKEISKMLDIPIGTVMWSYNTSIKKLRLTLTSLASIFLIMFGGLLYKISNVQVSMEREMVQNDYALFGAVKASNYTKPINLDFIIYISLGITLFLFIYLYFKSDRIPVRILSKKKKS